MAAVVKLANILVKYQSTREPVSEYLASLGDEWKSFVEGELKDSNETNTKSLGGQQPRSSGMDDDDMEGSLSMDSILAKFQNFSTERSKRENSHDDDEEEEDEDDEEEPKDTLDFLKDRDAQYEAAEQEPPKEQEPLQQEYLASNYWKVELHDQASVEDLMAEMGF
jgi:hypothetical protein